MKKAATILLAAAMGIHCGAPSSDGDRTALAEEVVTGETGKGDGDRASSERGPVLPGELEVNGSSARAFVVLPSLVLTTVTGPDGATYVAGTYAGSIVVGDSTFTSTGKDDVFVARREIDGRVSWARSVGSLLAESGPHLTFEEGRLRLLATTRGEVDCGAGPLGSPWNSEMFFMCVFDEAGTTVGGAVFPTGAK